MVFWIIRIPNLSVFANVSYYKFWLYDSKNVWNCKRFQKNIRKGDTIWFLQSGSGGRILAMATFKRIEARKLGPLINISMTNEELELPKEMEKVDTEIHFHKFFNLQELRIKADIRFARDFFEVDKVRNQEVYRVLVEEYNLIRRYGRLPRHL